MHHLFVTPVIAGALTAGVIALSPSFSDPYETAFASEEPVIERLDLEFSSSIAAPAEMEIVMQVPMIEATTTPVVHQPVRVAMADLPEPETFQDIPFSRIDFVASTVDSGKPEVAVSEVVEVAAEAEVMHLAVKATRLNMRAGPGTTFKKIEMLTQGTLLAPTGEGKGKWLEVSVLETGAVGWLHSDYVSAAE